MRPSQRRKQFRLWKLWAQIRFLPVMACPYNPIIVQNHPKARPNRSPSRRAAAEADRCQINPPGSRQIKHGNVSRCATKAFHPVRKANPERRANSNTSPLHAAGGGGAVSGEATDAGVNKARARFCVRRYAAEDRALAKQGVATTSRPWASILATRPELIALSEKPIVEFGSEVPRTRPRSNRCRARAARRANVVLNMAFASIPWRWIPMVSAFGTPHEDGAGQRRRLKSHWDLEKKRK